jgi:hypothetical protein
MPQLQSFMVKAGRTEIGTVHFFAWDDGMAVATGRFRPSETYRAQDHATQIGDDLLTRTKPLHVVWNDGRNLECDAIGLIDYSDEVGDEGRELIAFGVVDLSFRNGS